MSENNKPTEHQYPFYIQDQYIKDLSFENPNFLLKYQSDTPQQPAVSVDVETKVDSIQDEFYEVGMKVNVTSKLEEKDVFLIELEYSTLVNVAKDLDKDTKETILLVHIPFLMFPFVRNIISDVTRNGGYPPLLIEPIDFAALYVQKKQEVGSQPKPN